MKYLLYTILFCIPLIALKCSDDPAPKPELTELEKLPPATKEGKHTMGFLLNGRAWIPESSIEYGADFGDVLTFSGGGRVGDLFGGINIIVEEYFPLRIMEPYDLRNQNISSSSMSVDDGVKKTFFCIYDNTDLLKGELLITHYEAEKRIISGTFSMTFANQDCDTIRITDGRFDLLFTY